MATTIIPTMPDTWCLTIDSYKASYEGNKIYLGEQHNLERHTYVTVSITFQTLAKQREFFVWWQNETQSGGIPFFAKLPLFAKEDYYLMAQNKPFTQSVDTGYNITASFMIYSNRTKGQVAPPTAYDVDGVVEESSSNNIIMLKGIDIEDDKLTYEMVGAHAGVTVKGHSIIYTPPAGFKGTKTFKYKVFDGVLYSNEANISIVVAEVDAPIAYDMTIDVANYDGVGGYENYFDVKAKDLNGKSLTCTITDKQTTDLAAFTRQNLPFVRVKHTGANQVQFKYKINNGVKDSQEATVKINYIAYIPIDMSKLIPKVIKIPQCVIPNKLFEFLSTPVYNEVNKTKSPIGIHKVSGSPSLSTFNSGIYDPLSKFAYYKHRASQSGILGATEDAICKATIKGNPDFNFNISMVDIRQNKKYMIAKSTGSPIHIPVGDTYKTGVYLNNPTDVSPSRSDFPDVANWDDLNELVGDGYTDVFSTFNVVGIKDNSGTAAPTTDITATIDDKGELTIEKKKTGTFNIEVEVGNPHGDKKSIFIGVFTYVYVHIP